MPISTGPRGGTPVLDLLTTARARARASERAVLVSASERISRIDPLAALAHGDGNVPFDGALAEQTADRMYWSRPVDGIAIAGLGTVASFATSGPGRFTQLDAQWRALLDGALIGDPPGGEPRVGPMLMGGFAFEADGPTDARWQGFPASHFTLPRLQLTAGRDGCWLTTTVLVAPDGRTDIDSRLLGRLRESVLSVPEGALGADSTALRQERLALTDERPAQEWRRLVSEAVAAIRAGVLAKVVLARAQHATAPHDFDVLAVLRHLRATYADCYVFGCWRGNAAFVGASPERLARVDARDVRTSSLAGSIRRGATPEEDVLLGARLLDSAKERGEHAMVRSALLDGLATLCDDVSAPTEPSLVTLPNVHHLFTPVRGQLRAGGSPLELIGRLHPTPAVGGAPREAALHFIHAHEALDRGWYAAPVGWVGRERGEFAVALRSALIRGRDAWLFAGCGIVADSDPDLEYAESLLKLAPMTCALAAAVGRGGASAPRSPAAASGGPP